MKKVTGNTDITIVKLEARVTALEKIVKNLLAFKKPRKKKEYTPEQKAIIRARLLAGQEAARKKRETENRSNRKVKTEKQEVTDTKPSTLLKQ